MPESDYFLLSAFALPFVNNQMKNVSAVLYE